MPPGNLKTPETPETPESSGSAGNLELPSFDPTPAADRSGPDGAGRPRRAIVTGWGLVGRFVADGLGPNVEVTIVELNLQTIETQLSLNRRVVFGDCCEPETLRRAGIVEADALIVTIPDTDAVIRACRVARELHPSIFIAARANFLSRGHLARDAGADIVVVEEVVTAEAMRRAVIENLLGDPGGK